MNKGKNKESFLHAEEHIKNELQNKRELTNVWFINSKAKSYLRKTERYGEN